jgi:hypothetical protein
MFEGWENYYLMIGSSAGALIGLMFVVMTLTAGRDPAELERGKHLYTSPIVWHLGVILVLSGAASVPGITSKFFGFSTAALAVLGFGWGIRSAVGISWRPVGSDSAGFDMFWYGVAPAFVYVGLGIAALGLIWGASWGAAAIAAGLMALLLVSIHAEWDLVTYLAPTAGQPPPSDRS